MPQERAIERRRVSSSRHEIEESERREEHEAHEEEPRARAEAVAERSREAAHPAVEREHLRANAKKAEQKSTSERA